MFIGKQFGRRLKYARKKAGYTAATVAEILHMQQCMIYRYESGETIPGINRVCAMANLYGCSIDWLCGMGVDV